MLLPDGEKNVTEVKPLRIAFRGRSYSLKASADRTPVQCTGSPGVSCSSRIETRKPFCARRIPAYRPPGPAPMMMTSSIDERAAYSLRLKTYARDAPTFL